MGKNKGFFVGILVVLIILALLGSVFITSYNRLVRTNEELDLAWAQVENQLKRRTDLIPNLVNTVKGYAEHEKQVIGDITKARSNLNAANTPKEYAKADGELTRAINNLNIVVENYPDLKANENFKDLQIELSGTENRLSTERMRYNDKVKEYNQDIKQFPRNIIGGILGFEAREYYPVSEADKEVPNVNF